MIEKARQGHWPTVAPVGYLNNLATHRIEPDSERAPIIGKLFEWYASGECSLKVLTQKAAAAGLTNRTGGSPLERSGSTRFCRIRSTTANSTGWDSCIRGSTSHSSLAGSTTASSRSSQRPIILATRSDGTRLPDL